MLNFHSHLTFTAEYEHRTYFQVLLTQLKQKIVVLKLWVRFQIVVDFQGWSKMTLKIKMPISPFLEVGFEKFFDSHL